MSPTSYQTAPPRALMIATVPRSVKRPTLATSQLLVIKAAAGYSSNELSGSASTKLAQRFTLCRSQADTIFAGSMASRSNCSSRIFPSFPIRKFTRRAALYLSV